MDSGQELPNGVAKLLEKPDDRNTINLYDLLNSSCGEENVKSIRCSKKYSPKIIYVRFLFIVFKTNEIQEVNVLITVLLLGFSDLINEESLSRGILNNEGIELLFNLLFITTSSLLGSLFYSLKTIILNITSFIYTPEKNQKLAYL